MALTRFAREYPHPRKSHPKIPPPTQKPKKTIAPQTPSIGNNGANVLFEATENLLL